jgi:rubredoxin
MKAKPDTLPTLRGDKWRGAYQAQVSSILGGKAPRVSSRGRQFYNRDRWTLRILTTLLCGWAAKNPDTPLTDQDLRTLLDKANAATEPYPEIVVCRTPDHMTIRTGMALIGGADHEAFHSLYSCKRTLRYNEVKWILDKWNRIPDWSRFHKMIQTWSNVAEDIRIERVGRVDFPGTVVKLHDLQDFILNMEAEGEESARAHGANTKGALSIVMRTYRDVGLGYVTPTQELALEKYKADNPEAMALVLNGPLSDLLRENIALKATQDVACLRIAFDVIIALYDISSKVYCPKCGARGSKLTIRPKRDANGAKVKGKAIVTCDECGWVHEMDTPDSDEDNDEDNDDIRFEDPKVEQDSKDKGDDDGDDADGDDADGSGSDKSDGDDSEEGDGDSDDTAGSKSDEGKMDGSGDDGEGDEDPFDSAPTSDQSGDADPEESDADGGSGGSGSDEDDESDDDSDDSSKGSGDDDDGDADADDSGSGSEDAGDSDDDEGAESKGDDSDNADDAEGAGGHSEGSDQHEGNDWSDLADEALDQADDDLGMHDNNSALEEAVNDASDKEESRDKIKPDEKPYRPLDTGLDDVELVVPSTRGKAHDNTQAQALLQSVKGESSYLRARLRNIVRALEMTTTIHGLRKGRDLSERYLVDTRASLMAGKRPNRAYWDRDEQVDTSVAAAVVLDESYSMKGILKDATRMLCAITEPLDGLGAAVQVSGFRNGRYNYSRNLTAADTAGTHRQHGVIHDVFKTFDEKFRAVRWRFANTQAEGGTPMSDGIQFGLDALNTRTEGHRILFVITDGDPDPGHAPVIKRQIRLAKAAGILVIGVGVGGSAHGVKTLYPDHVYSRRVADVPRLLIAKLNELIDATVAAKRGRRMKRTG